MYMNRGVVKWYHKGLQNPWSEFDSQRPCQAPYGAWLRQRAKTETYGHWAGAVLCLPRDNYARQV